MSRIISGKGWPDLAAISTVDSASDRFPQKPAAFPLGKDFFQNAAVRGVVIDDKNRQVNEMRGFGRSGTGSRALQPGKTQGEIEGAAFAGFAFHHQVSAHHLYQPGGDGEAQTVPQIARREASPE